MSRLIDWLKSHNVHNEKLAIVRFLIAFGMLLTVVFNDTSVVANHDYTHLYNFRSRHNAQSYMPLKQADLFMEMPPERARVVVIIILLFVMTGLLPQLTSVLHFWACFSINNYFLVLNGGDHVAYLLSLLLLPICLTDPRLNQWRANKHLAPRRANIIANVAFIVIQFQAAILYLDAGLSKLFLKEWRDGTAVYYYTSHYRLGAPDWLRSINETITLTPFVAVISWSVLLLEVLLFACLFFPARIKKRMLLVALIFHLLIAIDFGLITFFLSMAGLLIIYLDDENTSVKLLRKFL